jgi:hypothetical protein
MRDATVPCFEQGLATVSAVSGPGGSARLERSAHHTREYRRLLTLMVSFVLRMIRPDQPWEKACGRIGQWQSQVIMQCYLRDKHYYGKYNRIDKTEEKGTSCADADRESVTLSVTALCTRFPNSGFRKENGRTL